MVLGCSRELQCIWAEKDGGVGCSRQLVAVVADCVLKFRQKKLERRKNAGEEVEFASKFCDGQNGVVDK